ncbi:hypothetical protein GIB67_023960 [Kingdonia uniflora]|uniref:DNA-directed RNA polymerase n=1 Tax=Kingdonia uniflora TaxID=39325 RepID=A0A7J7LPU1_9MAGN|nr:hypothetical protein GIB67_023960 [Kingdonia uniflora]
MIFQILYFKLKYLLPPNFLYQLRVKKLFNKINSTIITTKYDSFDPFQSLAHYKTNKPEKDGLFCHRIFGPIKIGICACGNYRVIGDEKEGPKFCEQYGVEFVDSRIRRYQMGYIKLTCPVTHVWYLKRLPSYIANLLDKPLKELEGLVYCDV